MAQKRHGPRKKEAPAIRDKIEVPDIGELKKQADAEPKELEPAMDQRISEKAFANVSRGVRPRGIVAMVKALTDSGWETLQFWNRVYRGEEPGFSGRERLEASKLLFERGFGRPIEATVLIDATKAEQDEEMRTIPTDQLFEVLKQLAPPPGAAIGQLEKHERLTMPDLVQGAALGQVVDAEYEMVPDESPESEIDHANREIMQSKLDRAALEHAGLIDPPKRQASRVIVKQNRGSVLNVKPNRKVYVNQPPQEPEDDGGPEEP